MRHILTRSAGLVRSMEEEANLEAVTASAAETDNAGSAETELLDVNESATEGDVAEAKVDDAVEAVASLEAFAETLSAAASNGGLTREGGQVLAIAVEGIYKRVGFSNTKSAVSLESFGQGSSRVGATTLAMEDIKDKIREIWKAICAAIKRAYEWAKGHFDKIFGAAQNLQKRAKGLQEKAKAANGRTMKEKTFENERIVKALADSKGVMPTAPSTNLATVKAVAEKAFDTISAFNATLAEAALEELNKDVADGQGATAITGIKTVVIGANAGLNKVADPKTAGFGEPNSGMTLFQSPELMGNKAYLAEMSTAVTTGEAAAAINAKVTSYLGQFDPKAKEPTKTSVATLQVAECGKIGDVVDELMTDIINYKAKLAKASDLQKKLAAAAEKMGKDSTTETDKDKAKYFSLMQKITSNAVTNLNRGPASMSAYVLNTSKTVMDYAELSLKQFPAK